MAKPTKVMVANDIQAFYNHAQWQNTHKGFQIWGKHELILPEKKTATLLH